MHTGTHHNRIKSTPLMYSRIKIVHTTKIYVLAYFLSIQLFAKWSQNNNNNIHENVFCFTHTHIHTFYSINEKKNTLLFIGTYVFSTWKFNNFQHLFSFISHTTQVQTFFCVKWHKNIFHILCHLFFHVLFYLNVRLWHCFHVGMCSTVFKNISII